jgi:hypothetical protein
MPPWLPLLPLLPILHLLPLLSLLPLPRWCFELVEEQEALSPRVAGHAIM